MTGTFSNHETDPTAITTYNKLKHGYDSRQSSGVRITGFWDKEGEENNYIISGHAIQANTQSNMKKANIPPSKNRYN